MRWCAEQSRRPLSAEEVLVRWPEVAERAAAQRDDQQAVTLNDVVTALQAAPALAAERAENLVAYLAVLPRDMRFGLVKALLRIPAVAAVLSQDRS